MWVYVQSTGALFHGESADASGEPVTEGYSGFGEGKNNPAMEAIHDVGPIPRGFWHIGEPECVTVTGPHGPFVLPLTPNDGTNTHGREGFLIHGDSIAHSGSASHGCIIVNRHAREEIAASHDQLLKVIA